MAAACLRLVLCLILATALLGCPSDGEDGGHPPPQTWSLTVGTAAAEDAFALAILADGSYALAGYSEPSGAKPSAYLVRIDPSGKVMAGWPRQYGAGADWLAYGLEQMPDGGLAVAGSVFRDSALLFRTDLQGNMLSGWPRKYGFSGSTTAGQALFRTSNGDFLIPGYTDTLGSWGNNYDIYVLRTDPEGKVRSGWPKVIGGGSAEYGAAICETGSGGFAILGDVIFTGQQSEDLYLTLVDAQGAVLPGWPKTYGGSGRETPATILPDKAGGFIILGSTASTTSGRYDIYLLRTNAQGEPLSGWPKTFGGDADEIGLSLAATQDGGYVFTGFTSSSGAGKNDVYLHRLDSEGNPLPGWPKTYGGPENDVGRAIRQTPDGGFLIAGHTQSFGSGSLDFYILKTDASGNIPTAKP